MILACLPAGAEPDPSALFIGSWNLQNFLVANRYEDGRFRYAYPLPEDRKKRIRQLILMHHPDLLFLQEMGSPAFLFELQQDLAAAGLDYPYSHFSGFEDSRSGLAFLSRIDPGEVIFHDPGLRRGLQEVRFVHREMTVRIFHVHLKSRYSSDPSDPDAARLRDLEISSLSRLLSRFLASDAASLFLLLGDFNTPFNDPLIQPLASLWIPLTFSDSSGNPNTYFHQSGVQEILDGFWIPRRSPLRPGGSLQPLPHLSPSDHRFLLLRLPSPS